MNAANDFSKTNQPTAKELRPGRRSWLLLQLKEFLRDGPGTAGLVILLIFFFVAAFGERLTPYGPNDLQYMDDNTLARAEPPSSRYWFGTTTSGRDVFSQTLSGARVAVVVGFLSAFVTVFRM